MSRRLRNILLAAILAATAALASGAAPAHAARGMEVALQDDGAFVGQRGLSRSKALGFADKLFVSRIRVNLAWAQIVKHSRQTKAPKHRRYDFAPYDVLYNRANAHGIKLQLTLSGPAPAWATGNRRVGNDRIDVKYFGEFARAVARHFRGHADRYAIWNEPNYVSWNSPLSGAAKTYYRMYSAAYREIRALDPSAKILIGETSPFSLSDRAIAPLRFLRDVVGYGALRADGYAHHPYDFRHPVDYRYPGSDNATIATIGRLTSQLDELAHSGRLRTPKGKPLDLYLTEYGYMASGSYRVPEDRRAQYVTRAFQMALDNPRVREMTQYLLVTPSERSMFFDTSIVSRTGKRSRTFNALQSWAKKQAGRKRIAVRAAAAR